MCKYSIRNSFPQEYPQVKSENIKEYGTFPPLVEKYYPLFHRNYILWFLKNRQNKGLKIIFCKKRGLNEKIRSNP